MVLSMSSRMAFDPLARPIPPIHSPSVFAKSSEKAIKSLKQMIWDDEITDIQEQAVFALSQQENSVDELIHISRSHPNPSIRKKAIFWLGQSNDERALEEIIRIIKDKG